MEVVEDKLRRLVVENPVTDQVLPEGGLEISPNFC